MVTPTTTNETTKRSPIFGRISVFSTVEEATKEHAERESLLVKAERTNLYSVYQVPVPNSKECYYAVELNPSNAISTVAQHLGWVASKLGGVKVTVTPDTVVAQAAANNWSTEELDRAIEALKKAKKGK